MDNVLNHAEYERLFESVDAALQAYKLHRGPLCPLDQELLVELQSIRMWLLSILRTTAHRDLHRPPVLQPALRASA